jgi:hypothetical protein
LKSGLAINFKEGQELSLSPTAKVAPIAQFPEESPIGAGKGTMSAFT